MLGSFTAFPSTSFLLPLVALGVIVSAVVGTALVLSVARIAATVRRKRKEAFVE